MSIKNRIKRGISFLLHGEHKQVTANIAMLAPSELLKGRTALITGGTSGIGFAIAKAFLNAGASVIITGRNTQKLDSAVEKLKLLGQCKGYVMDNTNVSSFEPVFNSMLADRIGGG